MKLLNQVKRKKIQKKKEQNGNKNKISNNSLIFFLSNINFYTSYYKDENILLFINDIFN